MPRTKSATAKTTAKKTTAKKPRRPAAAKVVNSGAIKSTVTLQYGERSVSYDTLVDRFKDIWTNVLGKKIIEIETVDFYIKPEENKVYYVAGSESGDFDL